MSTKYTPRDFAMKRNIRLRGDDIGWIFTGEWCKLDNFYEAEVQYNGFTYQTSEHAFAAAKMARRTDHDFVAFAPNPGIAKERGRRLDLRKGWDEIKFQIMYDIVLAKMQQNADCREDLLKTGSRMIYEGNTWNDRIWGVTGEEPGTWHPDIPLFGMNALGIILMRVRQELRNDQ